MRSLRRLTDTRHRDRGAAAVEFALVLLPLLLILFGIIDFGRAFYSQVTITQAAREGARLLALHDSGWDAKTRSAANGLAVTVTPDTTCAPGATQTSDATVRVTYQFNFSLLSGFIPLGTKTLTGIGHMPCGG